MDDKNELRGDYKAIAVKRGEGCVMVSVKGERIEEVS